MNREKPKSSTEKATEWTDDQGGDTYQEGTRQVDEQRRGVLSALPNLRQPVRPKSERRTTIRQTIPKKTSVEVETSTLI